MSTSTQPRQPSGTPVGGQFAGKANPEANLVLDETPFTGNDSKPPKRTDVHRPVELTPEDYEWVGAYDNQPEPGSFVGPGGEFEVAPGVVVQGTNWANAEYRYLSALVESSTSARYGDGFQCDHCGARIRYVAVYRHKPTGDHIAVGETCADGRLSLDKATFQRLRKAAELDRKQQANKKAARARLEEITDALVVSLLDRDADLDAMDDDTRSVYDHEIVSDIRRRLWQYGAVSDKQVDLVRRIYEQATAEPEPEPPKVPVPVGAQQVEGTVRAMRFQESQWGGSVKMLVEVETPAGNYKVWGTLPSALRDLYRIEHGPLLANGSHDVSHHPVGIGAKVRFNANCAQSSDDPSFGFFARPTKAELIETPAGIPPGSGPPSPER
jgi:hypothetical protein